MFNLFGGGGCNCGCKSSCESSCDSGCNSGFGGCSWIIILIILFCVCGGGSSCR